MNPNSYLFPNWMVLVLFCAIFPSWQAAAFYQDVCLVTPTPAWARNHIDTDLPLTSSEQLLRAIWEAASWAIILSKTQTQLTAFMLCGFSVNCPYKHTTANDLTIHTHLYKHTCTMYENRTLWPKCTSLEINKNNQKKIITRHFK